MAEFLRGSYTCIVSGVTGVNLIWPLFFGRQLSQMLIISQCI